MDKNPLVENEGVNAGSAEQNEDAAAPQPGSVRSGGRPDEVEPKAPVDDLDSVSDGDDSELLGASTQDGQDAGSIE